MTRGNMRETSLCQQTLALLWKNVLLKWRRKWHSILEWLQDLAFILLMFIISAITASPYMSNSKYAPAEDLGRLDKFSSVNFTVGFVPSPMTRDIMQKVSKNIIMPDITVQEYEDEEQLVKAVQNSSIIGVTFDDKFSYHIRYFKYDITDPNDYIAYMGHCINNSGTCYPTLYWKEGFLSLQASIDSAIIELTTNHSIWENMASIIATRMKCLGKINRQDIHTITFIFAIAMCYVSMAYLLALNVTRERCEMREILKMMRLKNLAFWLSWGLLYSGYVLILANLMTLVTRYFMFLESSYGVIMFLFFLYGISSLSITFMLSALLRNPRVTAITGFCITLLMTVLSLLLIMRGFPKAFEVLLSIFPPFAFSVGIVQSVHLELDGQGVYFTDFIGDSSHMLTSFIMLILDSILYMALTLYFDKIMEDKYGMKYEPLFFLRSSYWSKEKKNPTKAEGDGSEEIVMPDFIEKVPTELCEKRSIRINNVKKIYNDKDKKVEALRGLNLDIYEGQITCLLGHSGAGKSTLLNILSGMCPATSGLATVYNYSVLDMDHLDEIRKISGFCPQADIKFDPLTVKENLQVFAKFKGIPSNQVEEEVQEIISQLHMNNIQDVEANKLSGGQRRKLTLGISLLGNPQILLLDEPTAGMDPCSRHHIWTLLKNRKTDGVTLFSTQFMDEADILADRKAVISNGRLKCVGTSMFLKRKWGIGYHLRMMVSPSCDSENITSLIKQHISTAKLTAENEEELTYTLPFEFMEAFPDLFSHLDTRIGQGILSYGVSMTTLDDVFLKLEGESEIEQGDYGVFSREPRVEEGKDDFSEEMDESLLLMSDSGNVTLSGCALWRQQVLAIAKTRFLKLRRDTKSFRAILVLLILFLVPLVSSTVIRLLFHKVPSWELTPKLYFQSPRHRIHNYYTNILVNNNTGSSIDDFVAALKEQDMVVDVKDGNYDTETTIYRGALEVSRNDKGYTFRIIGNPKALNSLPVLVNIISNALLKTFKSPDHIRIWNNVIGYEGEWIDSSYMSFFAGIILMVFASGFPPHFAMSSIEDNRIKARSQLWVSGLFPSAYWLGQALVDVVVYWILLFLMFGILFVFHHEVYVEAEFVFSMIICVIGYSAALVLYVYVIAFIFGKGKSHSDSWSFFFVFTSFLPTIHPHLKLTFLPITILYMTVFPASSLIVVLTHIIYVTEYDIELYDELTNYMLAFTPYLHIFMYIAIFLFLEWKFGMRSLKKDPIFRTSKRQIKIRQNPEELEDADDDVLAEREKVKNHETKSSEERPVIIVDSLRKEYKIKKGSSIFKKKIKKAATKNISFCVKKGEVLGLLGPNGAGKTTSIYMLAGEVTPTAGKVVFYGSGLAESQTEDDTTPFLGYCPQESPLWSNLTVKEHLEIYAAVKGMKKEDADTAIKRVGEALGLKDHLHKQAKNLSAGISRKVCFAISMLGNPTIVLLDEPSTGLDPKGQQRLWRAIRAAFKNKERGAILTTHYMEEAEAVCDRVAIMISGKLRCIGSIQQLKSKFGKGYLLEIKVKDSQRLEDIHKAITKVFPKAIRQDRFSSLLVYKIPMDNVKSLSHAFTVLEEAKRKYDIEEYNFSQPTLEQVFIDLAKEQETDDFNLDSTFQWKHLRTESI
ncbi:ABC-type organic anion transporter ABCA8 [Bombina bombina]|uniref:ABC-type organic anion transporter ABCA8 n=1 Tax=Bombina bombina TaxID=8345 RepID=UPI00235AB6F5|nr:ABC-type organic anion transporter ABCA8 [Bombina bombina]